MCILGHGVQEVGGSNPLAPTRRKARLQRKLHRAFFFDSTRRWHWFCTDTCTARGPRWLQPPGAEQPSGRLGTGGSFHAKAVEAVIPQGQRHLVRHRQWPNRFRSRRARRTRPRPNAPSLSSWGDRRQLPCPSSDNYKSSRNRGKPCRRGSQAPTPKEIAWVRRSSWWDNTTGPSRLDSLNRRFTNREKRAASLRSATGFSQFPPVPVSSALSSPREEVLPLLLRPLAEPKINIECRQKPGIFQVHPHVRVF